VHTFTLDMHLSERDELDLRQDLTPPSAARNYRSPTSPSSTLPPAPCAAPKRWPAGTTREHGPIPPARFIPMAEQAALINELGLNILDMAGRLRRVAATQHPGAAGPDRQHLRPPTRRPHTTGRPRCDSAGRLAAVSADVPRPCNPPSPGSCSCSAMDKGGAPPWFTCWDARNPGVPYARMGTVVHQWCTGSGD
jgi:hypothetical protein